MTKKYSPIILEDNQLQKILSKQKLDIWVNSYGGSGSTWIRKNIEQNKKYKITNDIWKKKLCHFIRPINNLPIKYAIYIYGNPLYSLISTIKRNIRKYSNIKNINEINFYKMLPKENKNLKYSEKLMLENMNRQMKNWKYAKVNYPIIYIKYEKIGNNMKKFLDKLNIKLKIPYHERRTTDITINNYKKLPYINNNKKLITTAINTYNSLPDFYVKYPKK